MSEPVLTADLDEHLETALDLEFEIAADYNEFVFGSPAEARSWQKTQLESGAWEVAPPWTRLMTVDGRLAGLYAAIPGEPLRELRLLGTSRLLRRAAQLDPATRHRMRLANNVAQVAGARDFYLSRFGVVGDFRGHGLGGWLLDRMLEHARELGLSRCILEVHPERRAAVTLYQRAGFGVIDQHEAVDAETGRRFARLWMTRPVS